MGPHKKKEEEPWGPKLTYCSSGASNQPYMWAPDYGALWGPRKYHFQLLAHRHRFEVGSDSFTGGPFNVENQISQMFIRGPHLQRCVSPRAPWALRGPRTHRFQLLVHRHRCEVGSDSFTWGPFNVENQISHMFIRGLQSTTYMSPILLGPQGSQNPPLPTFGP